MTLAVLLKHVKLGTVKTPRDYARYAFMILSVAAFCYACLQVNQLVTNSKLFEGNASIKAVAYIEPVKVAITQKLEGAKGLFQASLLFMAVLWGLVIARREERVLGLRQGSWPEWVMFIIANALFAASAYCYVEYTDAISRVHALGDIQYDEPKDLTIMDYRDPRINNLYVWQVRIWVAATFVTAFTLLSAHALRDDPKTGQSEPFPCEPSAALPLPSLLQ